MDTLFWKRQARTWHWMSGAICLIGVLAFSITGITLNHAHQIPAAPVTEVRTATLPPELLAVLRKVAEPPDTSKAPAIPAEVRGWLAEHVAANLGASEPEWTDIDVYVGLPRPGGDAWTSIDLESGEAVYESTSRGTIAYLNDLHKGRNTGPAWSWFIDVFAIACILFCLTGLWLLQMHARRRRATWPLTVAGLVVPLVLMITFIH